MKARFRILHPWRFFSTSTALLFVLYIVLGLGLVIGLYYLYNDYTFFFKDEAAKKDFPWALITVLGAAPVTLYMWYWTHENNRNSIDDQRFQAAIVNLGSKELNIRLAGIYTLENLVEEHGKRSSNIIEVLCSYVRSKVIDIDDGVEKKMEIKICMDIISRIWEHNRKYWNKDVKIQPDLRKINIVDYELWHINLSDFFMEQANFEKSYLEGANLIKANLNHANLRNVHFTKAKLKGTIVYGADLRKAKGLKQEMVNKMKGCVKTKLPKDLKRPAKWEETKKCDFYLRCKSLQCEHKEKEQS